jgi:membrane protease YdiL (CAAX protease family)
MAYAIPAILVVIPASTSLTTYLSWKGVVAGIAFVCIAVWGLRKDKIPFAAIGLTLPKMKEAVILALVGWAIIVLANYFLIVVDRGDAEMLFGKPVLYILQYWIFVGIAEEVLFRGYMLTRLMNAWAARNKMLARIGAVAVASFFFATAHIPQRLVQVAQGDMTLAAVPVSVVGLSIAGITFSYLFLRTRNILWVGLIHGAVIVPLVGVGEDAFLPVIIVAILFTETFLFLQRRRQKNLTESKNQR